MCIKTLISEKDFVLRGVMTNRMTLRGYEIDTVTEPLLDLLDYDVEKYDLLIFSYKSSLEYMQELIFEIRRVNKSIGLVVISERLGKSEVTKLYESGVDLVANKPLDVDLLIAQIDSLKRRLESTNYKRSIGDISFNIAQQNLTCRDNTVRLNPTEAKILLKLSENVGETVLTNDEITKLLYQEEGYSSTKGTKVYIYRIRNKLKRIKSEKLAIKNHYGMGYYLVVND